MVEQDPTQAALEEILRTFTGSADTAQAVGAAGMGCIKPGIDDRPHGSPQSGEGATDNRMCNEGELLFGKKPENDCTTGEAMAQGATPGGETTVCVEQPGSGRGPTKAEQIGLDEKGIKQVLQSLLSARTPTERRIVFMRTCRRLESDPTAEAVHAAVSEYRVNQIREAEKGPLFHYHQTDAGNLDGILDQGGLLSTRLQRERGLPPRSTGSKPDVVQFTRDRYTADGQLDRPGLVSDSTLGVEGGIALVYGDDIMDTPGYDSVDVYPGTPSAPADKLHAVVVSDPNKVEGVAAKLAAKGVNARVVTRDQWQAEHYGNTA
jgi:hypothetical protein